MKAIIMAAGKGQRISKITKNLPKSFLEINGKKIIDYQLEAIENSGIKEIVLITGYKSKLFEKQFNKPNITIVRNPFYGVTNVLGSLWFALDHLKKGFYFFHADVFFDPLILLELVNTKKDCVLCVEFKKTVEEEMKVRIGNTNILEISKKIPIENSQGEFTGVAKIGPKSALKIFEGIKKRIEKCQSYDAFFEVVIQDCIDKKEIDVNFLDIKNRFSIEIDFPEDYEKAKTIM